MKILMLSEKAYKRLVNHVNCAFCKHHKENPYDEDKGQPTGCCIDCCCSDNGLACFKWSDNIKIVDLK